MENIVKPKKGIRSGENHPKAKLSNNDVNLIRDLHETHNLSYPEITEKFEGLATVFTIAKICRYQRRVT